VRRTLDAAFHDLGVGGHWLFNLAREQDEIGYPVDEDTCRDHLLGRGSVGRRMAVAGFWGIEEAVS
jgi:hypothetical protein